MVINGIQILSYMILALAFIPLFIYLLKLIRVTIPQAYVNIKWGLITISAFYCIINLLRVYLYLDLLYFQVTLMPQDPEVPLYLSEIIMTLLIILIMIRVS